MQPKHRTARLVAAGLAVFALTASACGDDDDTDVPASEEEMEDEEMDGENMDGEEMEDEPMEDEDMDGEEMEDDS